MVNVRLFDLIRRLRRPVVWRSARPERVTTIELRQWLPVGALGAILAWYVIEPTAEVVMALVALAGLLLCGFVWARSLARGVSAQRALRYAAMQVGDEMEEAISLINTSPLPVLWAEFVDHSDLPGYDLASVRAADGQSSVQWRAHALCTRRGCFTLGPWELRSGDPFGLFLVRQTYLQPQEVVVYPSLAALPPYLLPHTPTLGEHRLLRQPLPADTLNAITTRPYVPGDSLHRLHWRSTAKHDALFSKVFEPEATATVWLIADFDPAAHLGDGDDSTEETLVMVAASLAAQLASTRLAVGLLAARGGEVEVVLPRPGLVQFWDHLRALAPLHPAPGTLTLVQLLSKAQSLISARDLLIVLTPALDPGWPRALLQVSHRGARAEAILFDPASFGGLEQADAYVPMLAGMGVAAKVVRRGEVRPLTAVYGALRRWEFVTTGTGRAVALQTPRNAPSLAVQLASLQTRPR